MKKIYISLICIFLLSGCSIEYNLSVNNKIEENIISDSDNVDLYKLYKNSKIASLYSEYKSSYYYYSDNIEDENFSLYKVKDISNSSKYKLGFSYDFDISNYYNSTAVNRCYRYFSVSKEGNNVSILTSSSFNCFDYYEELEKVTINITSYYDVVQSNADQINGKKHTWIITPENASNKPIIFVYDESKKNITLIDYITNNAYIAVLLGIFIFIVLPILLFMKLKSKRANKI